MITVCRRAIYYGTKFSVVQHCPFHDSLGSVVWLCYSSYYMFYCVSDKENSDVVHEDEAVCEQNTLSE